MLIIRRDILSMLMMSMLMIAMMNMRMMIARFLRRAVIMAHRPTCAIGTRFRCEGLSHAKGPGAETVQHLFQDMVLADQQVIVMDLARRVPVADMPGQPWQVAGDAQNRLARREDPDDPPVFKLETPILVQVGDGGQVDHETLSVLRLQPFAPQHPAIVIEHHAVIAVRLRVAQQAGHRRKVGFGQIVHPGILVNVMFTLALHHRRRK